MQLYSQMATLSQILFRRGLVPVQTVSYQVISSNSGSGAKSDAAFAQIPNPFEKEKRQCVLCKNQIVPDYKNVRLLAQFQSPYTGQVYGKHITGLCTKQHKKVEQEITKAQGCGLMPCYHKDSSYLADPKLFDVENPIRNHRF